MFVMRNSIRVRAARAEDKDAILAFCRQTFSWGDYIPEVWDDWLHNTRGRMFVGLADRNPVGMMHVALLDDGAAWMEGMRVHPDFRRRGVASSMDATGRMYARECGIQLARLATGKDNIAAQNALCSLGYTRVGRYAEWTAKPVSGTLANRLVATEQAQVLGLWHEFSPNPIVANPEWRWEKLDNTRLLQLIPKGDICLLPRGFAIFRQAIFSDDLTLTLHALVGDEGAMRDLARAALVEANYRGFTRVEAMIVDDAAINRALESEGFQREGGMFIYEQVL